MIQCKKYWKKTTFLLLTVSGSYYLCTLFQPLLTDKALDVLVNIYSIFAGFLIGVIALIGAPNSIPSGSWQIAESSAKNIFRKLNSTKSLLYIYLITLFAIFLYKLIVVPSALELINSLPLGTTLLSHIHLLKIYAERFILFLSFIAFSYSFTFPL